jgi:hypothetical protein
MSVRVQVVLAPEVIGDLHVNEGEPETRNEHA